MLRVPAPGLIRNERTMAAWYRRAIAPSANGADSRHAGGTMMPIRVEAYTNGGIATGVVARPGHLRDVLEAATELVIEQSSWMPLDGSGETAAGELKLLVDDILLVVADEPDGIPVHAQWHSIELDAGPYRVHGEMPTMPGFDPGAVARPPDRRVRPPAGRADRAHRPRRRRRGQLRPDPGQPLHGRSNRRRPDARVLLPRRGDDGHRNVRRRARGRRRRGAGG